MSLLLNTPRARRLLLIIVFVISIVAWQFVAQRSIKQPVAITEIKGDVTSAVRAREVLETIDIKGRSPFSGYARSQFGSGWASIRGCDARNTVLNRDLRDVERDGSCIVKSGVLDDPYTGNTIEFIRGPSTSDDVQIDHVVALADAWQKGAQSMTAADRERFANDPLNLLAVDGPTNVQKGSSDAASWLPPNKVYRCRYVARQVAVKVKYLLWVTHAEYDAIKKVLSGCPDQRLPITE